jgi:hypothetical protein
VLKLSAGDAHELNHIISVLLGYDEDDTAQKEDNNEQKNKIVALLEDTAYSHLLEVLFFSCFFYTHKDQSPWGSSGPCTLQFGMCKIFTG